MPSRKRKENGHECISVKDKLAESFGICVHELHADEESYVVTVQKDIFAKLVVVSEMNGVGLEGLIYKILEKGIQGYGV